MEFTNLNDLKIRFSLNNKMGEEIINRQYFFLSSNTPVITANLKLDRSIPYNLIALSSASIPKTYYSHPEDSILTIVENGAPKLLEFPKGNYSVKTLKTRFDEEAKAKCAFTYVMSYDSPSLKFDTLKYSFTVSSALPTSMSCSDIYLAASLGFVAETSYPFVAQALTAPNTYNFQSRDVLLIYSDAVRNQEGLLQEIFTNGEPYSSTITWQNTNQTLNEKRLTIGRDSDSFTFRLLDKNGALISLNGNFWSIVVVLIESSRTQYAIREVIKYWISKEKLELDINPDD